jgi:hypothetical protein
MPIAIALERRLGYVAAADPDPLLPLTLQLGATLLVGAFFVRSHAAATGIASGQAALRAHRLERGPGLDSSGPAP